MSRGNQGQLIFRDTLLKDLQSSCVAKIQGLTPILTPISNFGSLFAGKYISNEAER